MDRISIDVLDGGVDADVRSWEALVDQSPLPDVYYRPGYALACREANTQSICALVIEARGFRSLLPLLISEPCYVVPQHSRAYRCAYSPYGYGGLLPLWSLSPPSCEQTTAWRQGLQCWCRQNDVICVVVRTHPMLGQESWFEETIDLVLQNGNPTVAVDLASWNERAQCPVSLKKGRRSDLSLARRNLSLSWACGWNAETHELLRVFQGIYNDRMRAVGAKSFYFFPDTYYAALARGLNDRMAVGVARRGTDPVGAALFMADNQYAHYHLSATNRTGNDLKAATLLITAGASWARQRGCTQIHLGGGVNGEDTLFGFKRTFGENLFKYASLTVIADRDVFCALSEAPEVGWPFLKSVKFVQ